MNDPTFAIPVEYTVKRTVYVDADTDQDARRLALDPKNWSGAEDPEPLMDTLRVAGGKD
jgi:hypothetical protein